MLGGLKRERTLKDINIIDVENHETILRAVGWAAPYVIYGTYGGRPTEFVHIETDKGTISYLRMKLGWMLEVSERGAA